MREILFRGKTQEGEWVEGYYIQGANSYIIPLNNVKDMVVSLSGNLGVFADKVIPETVGQFTGVTDKNGKKIFEGDIVQIGKSEEYDFFFRKGVVEFGEGTFDSGIYRYTGFYFREKDGEIDHNTIYKPDEEWEDDIAVIGNIHDTPNCLKE